MKNNILAKFEEKKWDLNKSYPDFRPGDTVRVNYKVQEGSGDKKKFRIQAYEGVVIKRKRGGVNGSFTVRKVGANSVGVERAFPMYSTYIDSIEVISIGIVRRSRLYYLRQLSGKAARIKSRFGGRKAVKKA